MLDKSIILCYDIRKDVKERRKAVKFYDVELLSIPKIKYACNIATAGHKVFINERENFLELCYVERGECICKTSSGSLVCESGSFYPLLFGEKFEIYTESYSPLGVYSIGLDCELSVNVIDTDVLDEDGARALMKNLLSGNRFLLPRDGLSRHDNDWMLPLIKKIVACKTGQRIGEETRAISLSLEFLGRVTRASMDMLAFDAKSFPTNAVAYSEMAIEYIARNYRKKISVIDLAEKFGLTPNYLHAIFKQVKGTTIIDYLTNYRMNLARIYIERFGLKAYEAAELVGIEDPAYFSRVFKKLYGKSVAKFKRG